MKIKKGYKTRQVARRVPGRCTGRPARRFYTYYLLEFHIGMVMEFYHRKRI